MFKNLIHRSLILTFLALALLAAAEGTDQSALEQQGRRIYLDGRLSSGKPLLGKRPGNVIVSGREAACVQCHRRSGLGGVEGNEVILPISGHALFGGGDPVIVQVDTLFNVGQSVPSKIYEDKAFAAAIRLGQHVSGRKLSALMPRYELSDLDLRALSAYLRTLSAAWSPGAKGSEIHLATVIAPGVSPERRKAFADTLNSMMNLHNLNVAAGGRHKVRPIERKLQSQRTWVLDFWELSGPSSTWAAQLQQRQQQNPAFAILSGLSDGEWRPVQDFCELNKVVCWFPSVDLVPEAAKTSNYSLYFSAGMQLEVDVIAKQLITAAKKPGKVVQLVGSNPLAQAAAAKVQQLFTRAGIEVLSVESSQMSAEATATALKSLSAEDALLIWLNRDELQRLVSSASAPMSPVFLSATLIGDSLPTWPDEWSKNARLVQRLELPKMRAANLARFYDWLKNRQLPLVDEKMQSEVYFAVNSFSWMVSSMLNNLYSDYLMDRAEATLSMREAMQVQEEIQSMMMGGGGRRAQAVQLINNNKEPATQVAESADMSILMKRESSTVYPRISLGIGQRFASKGAYLQKLSTKDGASEWVVP